MLSVIMLSVIMLSAIMLSVIMLSVIMLSIVFLLLRLCRLNWVLLFKYYAEGYCVDCRYAEYHYAECHVCSASFTLNVVMPSVVYAQCYDCFIMQYGIYA
jgi:hypothetical protein